MTDKERKRESRIPEFASREEEAEFWDTHDVTDYWDEMKPVKVRVAKNLSDGITIPLDPETLRELATLAKERGIVPAAMIRVWIMERLQEMQASQ